jgi:hypothetical protein
MTLELTFGDSLCYTPTFKINGINAKDSDFGEKYDRDQKNAPDYGCGNMQFTGNPFTPEILSKYNITEKEYQEIVDKLEEGLSFGCCGWCI